MACVFCYILSFFHMMYVRQKQFIATRQAGTTFTASVISHFSQVTLQPTPSQPIWTSRPIFPAESSVGSLTNTAYTMDAHKKIQSTTSSVYVSGSADADCLILAMVPDPADPAAPAVFAGPGFLARDLFCRAQDDHVPIARVCSRG
jgi:hypothetical protein